MVKKQLALMLFLFFLGLTVLRGATISGFVTDASNGEVIPYVNVMLKDSKIGAVTNYKGYFIIPNAPLGSQDIIFNHISYQSKALKKSIEKKSDEIFLKIELESSDIAMDAIEVTDEKDEINMKEIQVGTIRQSTQQIREIPQIAEADVFRAVQALPGVASISDFSSGLYVRGGSQDQNLILIDGIDVYNPTHFGGIFSTFNTDAVKDVELLKSSYPAKYGGRLSSVLNVTNKDGNRKENSMIARISLLSTSLTLENPWKIGNQKGSYMVSFRRTYVDLIDKMVSYDIPDYYFYDGHAKINWDVTDQDKLSFSTYFGKDDLSLDLGFDMSFVWGNETFSAQWTHLFSPKLFSHFILAGSHYGSDFELKNDSFKMTRENALNDITLRGALNYSPSEKHILDFGFDFKKFDVIFKVKTTEKNADPDALPDVDVKNYYYSLYFQDNWEITDTWTIQPGIRFTANIGKSNLKAEPENDNYRAEPRFSIRKKLTPITSVFFSYGHYYQFITSLNVGEASPFDLWFPVDESVDPGKSNHYTLGIKSLIAEGLQVDWEFYYKDYYNLVEYRPEIDNEWSNETSKLKDIFNLGKGYSFGTDIMLRTNWKGFEGFIGYTLGVTKRKIDDVNTNPENNKQQYFFPKYDRSHQVNIIENYHIGEKFLGSNVTIGLSYAFYTGQPYYRPEMWYMSRDGKMIPVNSYQDRFRLPNYSRFDISFKFKWDHGSWFIEPYLQVINMFNHHNVWYKDYESRPLEQTPYIFTVKEENANMFPRLPFIGVNIHF